MLLYLFWHWPKPGTDLDAYERDEAAFQRAVVEAAPEGLLGTAVFRCQGAPWANDGRPAYEDCYLLRGSAALDPLNEAAVRGTCKAPHDRLAAAMEKGAGGLYGLALGDPSAIAGGAELWLAKPPGMPYDEFYARVREPVTRPGASLWRRQMVLGPTPEFCALGAGSGPMLAGIEATAVARTPVWASRAALAGGGPHPEGV